MSNLRMIYRNIADAATITASSTAGALAAANLKTEIKGQVHRSVGTNVSYTLTWAAAQIAAGLVIPACNLTPDATMRVRAWDDPAAGALLLDTGAQPCSAGQTITADDLGQPLTAALFATGVATKATAWWTKVTGICRLQIDIDDPTNPAGWLDIARLVLGDYWEPSRGASAGVSYSADDLSQSSRNDAAGLVIDRAGAKESMAITLPVIFAEDRAELDRIMRLVGTHRYVCIVLLPGTESRLSHATTIYGIRSNTPIAVSRAELSSGSIQIDGW